MDYICLGEVANLLGNVQAYTALTSYDCRRTGVTIDFAFGGSHKISGDSLSPFLGPACDEVGRIFQRISPIYGILIVSAYLINDRSQHDFFICFSCDSEA